MNVKNEEAKEDEEENRGWRGKWGTRGWGWQCKWLVRIKWIRNYSCYLYKNNSWDYDFT
jgi:hypothetical protein